MSSANTSSLSSILLPIQQKTVFTLYWIYATFGVIGCLLNILLFSRKPLSTISCCTYFLVAAVAMLVQLVVYSIQSIYSYYYPNPMSYLVYFCKYRMYFILITTFVPRWAHVAATIDRYISSSGDGRLRVFATVRVAHRVSAAFVLVACVLSIFIPVIFDIRAGVCGAFYNSFHAIFTPLITIIASFFVPVPIMFIFTALIQRNLANKRQRRRILVHPLQTNQENHVFQSKRDQQVLRMLFVQIIVYIVITIPWVCYNLNNLISYFVPDKSADRIAIENFIFAIGGTLYYLFPTISFYLYTLTAKLFRRELRLMLQRFAAGIGCRPEHRIEPTTQTAAAAISQK